MRPSLFGRWCIGKSVRELGSAQDLDHLPRVVHLRAEEDVDGVVHAELRVAVGEELVHAGLTAHRRRAAARQL